MHRAREQGSGYVNPVMPYDRCTEYKQENILWRKACYVALRGARWTFFGERGGELVQLFPRLANSGDCHIIWLLPCRPGGASASGRLGGRPRVITAGKSETALQLRREGKTLKETAERISVSVSSLTRALGATRATGSALSGSRVA